MDDEQATLGFHVHAASGMDTVVVDVYDEQDRVFAESPASTWSDVDRLAAQFGVPQERITVDADARMVLDARVA